MHAGDTRAEALLGAFPEAARKHRRLRDLCALLLAFADSNGAVESVDTLVALARWTWEVDRRLPLPDAQGATPPAHRRLVALITLLGRPELALRVRDKLARFLGDAGGLKLLAEAGLPNDRGLLAETTDRLFRRMLPAPRDDKDLAALLPRLFPGKAELAYLQNLDVDTFVRLAEALAGGTGDGASVFAALERCTAEAVVLLAARVQGLGLAEGIRDRGRLQPLGESPFYVLPRAGDRFLALVREGDHGARVEAERAFRGAIDRCREELRQVLQRLETSGVSLDVVYTIEVIEQSLARLEKLIDVLAAAPGPERATAAFRLLVVLVRARQADRSLRELAYSNLHLLARKLVERAGQTGEHYITSTRREYQGMLVRAGGGGLLTAFTALVKLEMATLALPLFLSGAALSVNYVVSFVAMQVLGFTLATKQPSMTAAALAGALGARRTADESARQGEIVRLTASIVRSQLAAAVGNVTLVAVGALGIDFIVQQRSGHSLIDATKAEKVISSFHPTESGTIFYAFLTGIILWVASLAGGWVENFAVCHRLPQAIAEHGAGRLVGRRVLGWLSGAFARNISGLGISVALGVMLGVTPILGVFFGLPLDVRHVTLSTGQLAFALSALGLEGLGRPDILLAVLGIGIIFVLNLGVSFMLALTVAMRAREVPRRDRWSLFSVIARHFLRHPLQFLLPPRAEAKSKAEPGPRG